MRYIRFSHARNTWQASGLGVAWIDCPIDLARGYLDDGAQVIL
jgi:hypothetical protein